MIQSKQKKIEFSCNVHDKFDKNIHLIKNNISITDAELLRKINYDILDCLRRSKCIVSEFLCKNTIYYYLLFLELKINWSENKNKEDVTSQYFKRNIGNSNLFIEKLIEFVDMNIPIVLVSDLYYDNQNIVFYNYQHHIHYYILKGYNKELKKFILLDEKPKDKKGSCELQDVLYFDRIIDFEDLYCLCNNINELEVVKRWNISGANYESCFLFYDYKVDSKDKFINLDIILKEYVGHLMTFKFKLNKYEQEMIQNVKMYKENLCDYKDKGFFPTPKELIIILEHFYAIESQCIVLNYLLEGSSEKETLMLYFEDVLKVYRKIKGLACKSLFSNNIVYCDRIINVYLKNISKKEQQLYEYLIEIMSNYTINGSDKVVINNYKHRKKQYKNIVINNLEDFTKIEYANLEKHYNNKGFSNDLTQAIRADLTGIGECFFAETSPYNNIWEDDNILKFKTKIFNNDNDNISCLGQFIDIEIDTYSKIVILGCSEFGSFNEDLTIIFDNQDSANISIQFTDWVLSPIYKEKVLWRGDMLTNYENKLKLSEYHQVHISAKSYKIEKRDKIKGIKLPYCPNIHIFAISMLK